MKKPGCVVLAAGNASRFGKNKLEAALDGRSLILRSLETVPTECFSSVVVVTQYPDVLKLAGEFHFAALHNDRPELGLSRSLQLGLTALRDCTAVCFQVSDQPLLRRESVVALVNFWGEEPGKLAALSHGGVRGNPCIFPEKFYPELMELSGDVGGAAVIRRHEDELRLLEVPSGELWDVDTPQALRRAKDLLGEGNIL
ncbi:nucleotidyltransferase family protein [Oscillibacter sp.]|uniref:nucleotidyltransferase family protein n=1 Tax=Oscillibacter sp. TaxID=1945593 RepID=UPI0028ADFA62|nr:nucleotidyltransferase family protein [Oscillibacter sp.]